MLEEVLPYIRIDENEIKEYRDRIDSRALNLSPRKIQILKFAKRNPKLASWIFTTLRHLEVSSQNELEKTIMQSGAMIVFLLKKRDQETYTNLGFVVQRILNQLTEQNVQSYTMVSGLYLLDLLRENLEIYSSREQLLLLRYQYDLQSLFDFTDNRIALFIRVGYADPPAFRSPRKNVDEVIIDEQGNSKQI